MTDIFISYKREDRKAIDPLIVALNREGYSVWSDARTRISLAFIQQINDALRNAKCVLVVWSERAIASKWVLAEAYEGFERDCLIPLRIDGVKVPVPYSAIRTADFRKWAGQREAPEWRDLIAAVQSYCGSGAAGPSLPTRRRSDSAAPDEQETLLPPSGDLPKNPTRTTTRDDIEAAKQLVKQILERAHHPVPIARIAHDVQRAFPVVVQPPYDWLGHRTFMQFFKSLGLEGVVIDTRPPGLIHRASTEQAVAAPEQDSVAAVDENFQQRLFETTEAPLLAPEQYRRVFAEIASEIKAGRNTLGDIARVARDTLQANGHKIARGKISFILKGALYGGLKLDAKLINANQVGFCFATSLFNQCAASGWDIPPNESSQILSLLGLDVRA